MPDYFERHPLTRWVKADVPVYGDEWGNEYDEADIEEAGIEKVGSEHDITEQAESAEEILEAHALHPRVSPVVSPDTHQLMNGKPSISTEESGQPLSNSTLILSIDKADFVARNNTLDISDDDSAVYDGSRGLHTSEKLDQSGLSEHNSNFLRSQSSKSGRLGKLPLREPSNSSFAPKNTSDVTDFLPPTPTFQTRHNFTPASPETDVSERSYLSDADSIQREPDMLNVRSPHGRVAQNSVPATQPKRDAPSLHSETLTRRKNSAVSSSASMSTGERSFRETPPSQPRQRAPDALVLSIDRMNLEESDDDSSFDDFTSEPKKQFGLGHRATNGTEHQVPAEKHSQDSEQDDDWGYNSEHSSNFDGDEKHLELPALLPQQTASNSSQKHRVKTDALDSLIDDLSKMEGASSLFEAQTAQTLQASQQASTSCNLEYLTSSENKGFLPTLDSIHDMNLPDFANHHFDDTIGSHEIENPAAIETPNSLDEDHKIFVSNSRQDSIRKPPPVPSLEPQTSPLITTRGLGIDSNRERNVAFLQHELSDKKSNAAKNLFERPSEEGDDERDDKIVELPPPPIGKEGTDMSRRNSTVSTATFNMGAWKPNTSTYRDQFVDSNDNESQMNVSIFNKDELAYKKFTRMGPVSIYAPSISNSSCVSVPDTVDTTLQQINEDQLDEDIPDTVSVARSYQPVATHGSSEHSLGSSVLHDHAYERPKFHEETHTPNGSTDDLAPICEEGEPRAGNLAASTSALLDSKEALKMLKKNKYPVSNWKKIMAVSQPVDRINLLKKAKSDEENYNSGLSHWLHESLKSSESPHIQIGQLATQAYKNAQHTDIRRHTSIRSKVNLVRDKIEPGNLGMQASSLGRKFLSRGKKLMKQGSD